jgi:hypothetical protein
MELPFNLGPTPKDQDLLSIVPRAIPDFGLDTSASGEQVEYEDDQENGGCGSDDSGANGKITASQKGTDSEEDDQSKVLRIAAAAAGGLSSDIDFGEGSAAPKNAKNISPRRGADPSAAPWAVEVATARRSCSGSYCLPLWVTP